MTKNDTIMGALEQAARKESATYTTIMTRVQHDEHAVRYGALTPQIARAAGAGITQAQVRKVLGAAVKAGTVLRYQSSERGSIRWWPVGLWEHLQRERAGEIDKTTFYNTNLGEPWTGGAA